MTHHLATPAERAADRAHLEATTTAVSKAAAGRYRRNPRLRSSRGSQPPRHVSSTDGVLTVFLMASGILHLVEGKWGSVPKPHASLDAWATLHAQPGDCNGPSTFAEAEAAVRAHLDVLRAREASRPAAPTWPPVTYPKRAPLPEGTGLAERWAWCDAHRGGPDYSI